MKWFKLIFIYWLIIVKIIANSFPIYRFEHISTRQGLSHNTVIEIIQDEQGFMWFGTLNGLNRYDGYEFKIYMPIPRDSTTLSNNIINALFEDHNGVLWVGTLNGLNRYDRERDQFIRIYHDSQNPNSLVDNRIRCITEDHQGIIWIGTEGGLSAYNPDKGIFHNYLIESDEFDGFEGNIIHDIYEDSRKQLWIATEKGIFRFNRATKSFISYKHELSNSDSSISAVITICEDQWANLWIGTWGDGLQRFDIYNQCFKRVTLFDDRGIEYSPDIITKLMIDESGRLWICTYNDGLFILPQISGNLILNHFYNVQHYCYDPLKDEGIHSNSIWTVYEDRGRVVWLGNENGGIDKCDTKQGYIQHFRSVIPEKGGLSDNHVTSFYEGKNGIIWIGTRFGGLNRFDPIQNKFQVYKHVRGQNINLDAIVCLEGDGECLWIGTDGNGLVRYDFKNGSFTNFKHDVSDRSSIGENAIYSLYLDYNNTLWIGTWGGGLSKLNPDGRTFTNYSVDKVNVRTNVVTDIVEDKSGKLWLGTYGKGLVCFDPETEQMIYFMNNENDTNSIAHNNISALYFTHESKLWIGTMGGGLCYLKSFNPDSGSARFGRITRKNGLPDNMIESIVEDDNGNLWLGTNHGIVRLNPLTKEIRTFDSGDGFGQDIFYRCAVLKSRQGLLYFGGINGFNVFHPANITENPYVPPIAITKFKLFGKKVIPGNSPKCKLKRSIITADNIVLSYKDNFFSFEFSALDYSCPRKNKYAYMLEGFDQQWHKTDASHRIASYTNIPPGKYTFLVKGSNNSGVWNEVGSSIKIIITPPFWKTNWMLAIYIVMILLALFLIRMAVQIRERNRARNQMKLMEAEKMHAIDQLKLRFFTHISHEFRTPLTLIIDPIEHLLCVENRITGKKRRLYYNLILQNARRLLRLVDQIMDARKLDTGSMTLELKRREFISFVKAIFSVFRIQAEQRRITYSLKTEVYSLYFWFDPDKIEKAIYNVINNAFKFTPSGGRINVLLSYTPRDEFECENGDMRIVGDMKVEVKDTGIGISPEHIKNIFDPFYQVESKPEWKFQGSGIGLSLCKEFIEMHGGRVFVESTPSQGSTFALIIPVRMKVEEIKNLNIIHIHSTKENELVDKVCSDTLKGGYDYNSGQNNNKPLILVIEDDEDLRRYLVMELENQYSIIQATEGLSGYEIAVDKIPDLIVCDIIMPVMDGLEFCNKCKRDQRTSHIPIILLTADPSHERLREGLLSGADDYIVKPFNSELLKIRIENLLATRKKIQEKYLKMIYLDPKEIDVKSPDLEFIKKIIEIIEHNISDPGFSVDDLSYNVCLSRAQLYRKVRALIDQTPSDFIKNYRLQRAMQLLKKGYSSSEVCYKVGFRDPSYFSKCFKKQFGKTPQEIKKEFPSA